MKEKKLSLLNGQVAFKQTPKLLVKPCSTRWSSHLAAVIRLLELQQYVDLVVLQSPVFWQSLGKIKNLLEPFKTATDIIQSDSATLFDVFYQFTRLFTHIQGTDFPNEVRKGAATVLNKYWLKHVNIYAVLSSAVLSFDLSYQNSPLFTGDQRDYLRVWLIDWGVKYLTHYGLSDYDDASLHAHLSTQWSHFMRRTNTFRFLDNDVKGFKDKAKSAAAVTGAGSHSIRYRWDARDVWGLYLESTKELGQVAIAFLSITASEAAVERSFSLQQLVHSKLRNRLLDSTIEREMFLKLNSRALDKPDEPSQAGSTLFNDTIELKLDEPIEIISEEDSVDALVEEDERVKWLEAETEPHAETNAIEIACLDPMAIGSESSSTDSQEQDNQSHSMRNPTEEELEEKFMQPAEGPPSSNNALTLEIFIERYINENNIGPRYRWSGWREAALQNGLIQAGLNHTTSDVINKIRATFPVIERAD
jgi:hypothetical protein